MYRSIFLVIFMIGFVHLKLIPPEVDPRYRNDTNLTPDEIDQLSMDGEVGLLKTLDTNRQMKINGRDDAVFRQKHLARQNKYNHGRMEQVRARNAGQKKSSAPLRTSGATVLAFLTGFMLILFQMLP